MNETLKAVRARDGLLFMALLAVAFIVAVALLIHDYRSPPLQARASIEQRLQREGRFSPEIRRNVPLRVVQ